MYLILWCLSLVTDGLRPEVGYISDVAEVQEDPSLQMAWIWLEKVIGEDVTLCISPKIWPKDWKFLWSMNLGMIPQENRQFKSLKCSSRLG